MKLTFTDGYSKKNSPNQQEIEIKDTCVITNYDPRAKKPSQSGDLTVSVDKNSSTVMTGTVFQEDSKNKNKYSIFTELASYDGDNSNLTIDDLDKAYEEKDEFKKFIINLGVKEVNIRFDSHAGVMTIEFGNEVLRIDFKTWWERWNPLQEDSSKFAMEAMEAMEAIKPAENSSNLPASVEINSNTPHAQFFNALAMQESSDNQYSMSISGKKQGFAGLYQIGEAAFIDLEIYEKEPDQIINGENFYNNNWKGTFIEDNGYGIESLDDFLEIKGLQDEILFELMKKNWASISSYQNNLDSYVGDVINGQVITESGLLAGAHLLGVGNLKKYLEHGGQKEYDAVDGNKTHISKYISQFAGYDVSDITGVPNGTKAIKVTYINTPYEIQSGDNLSDIADKYNTTVDRIIAANKGLTKKNTLKIGVVIIVPVGQKLV